MHVVAVFGATAASGVASCHSWPMSATTRLASAAPKISLTPSGNEGESPPSMTSKATLLGPDVPRAGVAPAVVACLEDDTTVGHATLEFEIEPCGAERAVVDH